MKRRVSVLAASGILCLLISGCTTTVVPVRTVTVTAPVPAQPTSRVLDGSSLNDGVKNILEDDYKLAVDDVTCPDDEEVVVGNSFTCTVTMSGEQKQVQVTVKTTDGQYEVGQPQ